MYIKTHAEKKENHTHTRAGNQEKKKRSQMQWQPSYICHT